MPRLNPFAFEHRLLPNRSLLAGAAIGALVLLPGVTRAYVLSLAIEVFIFAIFALSFDLLLGYTGLPSFGHAAFLGLGAYLTAWLGGVYSPAIDFTQNLLIIVPVVIAITCLFALLIGFFALRATGVYFLMITLAFAQMLYSLVIRWSSVTGGSDGISGIAYPGVELGLLRYSFDSRPGFYYLALGFFLALWWLLHRLVNSPFGWALRGIKENEARMQALGYHVFRYKLAAFVIAGIFAGLAGMLLALFFRHAAPDYLYWTMSGQVMMMVIIGGTGTPAGPVLGAVLVRLMPNLLSSYTDRWQSVMGAVFIAFVLFAPQGLVNLFAATLKKGRR